MNPDDCRPYLLVALDDLSLLFTVCLYNKNWHQGVIGILASRIKEKYSRPTIIFASDESGFLKGSGRSIPGLHLRDTLDLISKRNSNLIKSFGLFMLSTSIELVSLDLFFSGSFLFKSKSSAITFAV